MLVLKLWVTLSLPLIGLQVRGQPYSTAVVQFEVDVNPDLLRAFAGCPSLREPGVCQQEEMVGLTETSQRQYLKPWLWRSFVKL